MSEPVRNIARILRSPSRRGESLLSCHYSGSAVAQSRMHAFTGVVVSFAVMATARGTIPLKLADVFGDHMVSQCDAKRWQFSPGHRHHLRRDGERHERERSNADESPLCMAALHHRESREFAGLLASTFLLNIAP